MNTSLIIIAAGTFLVSLVGFATLFLSILLLSKEVSKIPEILSRLMNIEMITTQLAEDVNLEVNGDDSVMWKTADGKYQASSFEELLHKMSSDPDSPLTADEIDAIKSVFNKITQQDDTPPDEPWRKK